jgi:site-specific recombinase XerD
MLRNVDRRRKASGLSIRGLARDLEISHSLLSLVLSGRRNASKGLRAKLEAWMASPLPGESEYSPRGVLQRFLEEKQSQLAPRTVEFYEAKLRPFVTWFESQYVSDVRRIDRHHAIQFLGHIRKGRRRIGGNVQPLSNGSLKLHHQTLKTFFTYVGQTCSVPDGWSNPLDGLKVKPSQAQTMAFSDDEIERMFEVVVGQDAVIGLRNRAILTVLLNSAVRVSELMAMNVSDVAEDGRVKVTGKGSKQRIVSVGASGDEAIEAYLLARSERSGALWKTYEGNRLTADGLRGVFNRAEQSAPDTFADGLYAHRFRHTAITRLLRGGVPLRSVQRYAGHTSPTTTLRYAQAIDAQEAIDWVSDR